MTTERDQTTLRLTKAERQAIDAATQPNESFNSAVLRLIRIGLGNSNPGL